MKSSAWHDRLLPRGRVSPSPARVGLLSAVPVVFLHVTVVTLVLPPGDDAACSPSPARKQHIFSVLSRASHAQEGGQRWERHRVCEGLVVCLMSALSSDSP